MSGFVYLCDNSFFEIPGIYKKVLMQIKALDKLGFSVVLLYRKGCDLVILEYAEKKQSEQVFVSESDYYRQVGEWIDRISPVVLYVRKKFFLDHFVMAFYEEVRQKFPSMKMVMELPTFPYDGEVQSRNFAELEIDRFYREHLQRYFDYTTNYFQYEEIFHIPSIPMMNGVDLDIVPLGEYSQDDKAIHLGAATSMARWNGFERIFCGLRDYYATGERKICVYCHIIGVGPELGMYKKMVRELGLERFVLFYGEKFGEELDAIMGRMDIGVLAMASYKVNLTHHHGIRAADYAARGLPSIYAFENDAYGQEYPFGLKFSNDDSPVEIEKIVEFYQEIRSIPQYKEVIREYARQHLSWEFFMQKMVCEIFA